MYVVVKPWLVLLFKHSRRKLFGSGMVFRCTIERIPLYLSNLIILLAGTIAVAMGSPFPSLGHDMDFRLGSTKKNTCLYMIFIILLTRTDMVAMRLTFIHDICTTWTFCCGFARRRHLICWHHRGRESFFPSLGHDMDFFRLGSTKKIQGTG
jgi:hypothetical protein